MCGIFAYIGNTYCDSELIESSNKIVHRGPDNSIHKRINKNVFLSFHRLAINGLNNESNQPFEIDGIHLICNGEIFNFKDLIKKYNIENDYKSDSDCEIIIHLYKKFGIDRTCKELDGEFAFILYDDNNDSLYIARDHIGVRSLFWSFKEDVINNKEYCICSEIKGLEFTDNVEQFPCGSYWCSNNNGYFVKYFDIYSLEINDHNEETIIKNIRELFISAVEKRLMSERKLACLLSGGLDSTTVSAIVASYYQPYSLNTYSIGLKGSIDLHYAKIASEHFKTNHTSIELTNEDFLEAIEKTIQQIESYDTTSVRASVGNYLVSLYIRDNSKDTVIFCGDVSDEIFASYRGFYYAPNDEQFHLENIKMLENINYFDVLRSDKSISGAGLEARVPFSDLNFLKYCMSIHPKYKRFSKDIIEKYLFRKAFDDILPKELGWRVKTAFSDGVSNAERPWYEIIKEYMDTKYTDKEYEENILKYTHNKPYDKESLYYREVYEKYYPNTSHTIPYFWKQPFMKEADPSAWLAEKNVD
jgi:asparagine synthase (glutamine-hydrolysing)